jgi:hypothetical protein
MRLTFLKANLDSWKGTKSLVSLLAAIKPVPYDCYINSCICYVRPHADQDECPYCNEARYNAARKPRKRFIYLPIIMRLVEYFKNARLVERMRYPAQFKHDPISTEDIFNGEHHRTLQDTYVTVDGEQKTYKFFFSARDIAFGLSTDGFSPFHHRKKTAWPLILFIRISNTRNNAHYVPLIVHDPHPFEPMLQPFRSITQISHFAITPSSWTRLAKFSFAPTAAEEERLGHTVSRASHFSRIFPHFPSRNHFPSIFMHPIYQNFIKNLVFL